MPGKLKTAVVGATGYSGLELTRILLRHPQVETPLLLSRQSEGGAPVNLADLFPVLSGNGSYPLQPLSWDKLKEQGVELLFLATPHEASRSLVPEAVAHGLRVIDLSGAWRLREAAHRAVYEFKDEGSPTAAEFTEKAVYGLPELHGGQISGAAVVANPGCYATSVILALAPLVKAGVVDRERGNYFRFESPASPARAKSRRRARILFPWRIIFRLMGYSATGIPAKFWSSCSFPRKN